MNTSPTSPVLRALNDFLEGRAGSWAINLVVIPLLVILAIALPPLALPQRVFSAGFTGASPNAGGVVSVADGAQFTIPPGATKSGVSIKLSTQARDAFVKSALAQNLPQTLDVKSPAYQPALQGQLPTQAVLSMPIPDGADPFSTLDVYGYNGKKWIKIPFQIYLDDQRVEAYLTSFMPQAVVMAQTGIQAPTISVDVAAQNAVPPQAAAMLAEVNPVGLMIAEGGGISGAVPETPETNASSPYQVLPTVSNFDGDKYRNDLVEEMITTPDLRKQHVQVLVDLAVEKVYPGLNIDYQNVSADNQADFTTFISELAQALHAKDKLLSVTMSVPEPVSIDTWKTGAFDWLAIGQVADVIKLPLPNARESYGGSDPIVQQYLQWAVSRVDRYKLQLTFSVMGRDEFGDLYAPIGFANAFKLTGPVDVPDKIIPESKVLFDMPRLRESGGVKFDQASGLYWFAYKDAKGDSHTVWIESADSLAKKVTLATEFNLRGVALRDLSADAMDARAWDALNQYHDSQTPAVKNKPVFVWRVNGNVVGKTQINDPRFTWTAPKDPGEVRVEAALSFDDGGSIAGTTAPAVVQVARPVAPTPAPPPAAAQPAAQPTKVAAAPQPAAPSSIFTGQNLFNYGAQLNWTNRAGLDDLVRMGFRWAKIQVRWCDFESRKGQADLSQIDRFMAEANAKGIKVMFSVVCAPNWSRADGGAGGSGPPDNMQDAADFMSGLAAKYCGAGLGAIEVWNEHNLLTEWHGKPISAALYMSMLKAAYPAIKSKCTSVVVVSGAPTPTGVTNSTAIDDVAFLHQMYQNGLKDYSDAIGAHPSGFCNAPDASVGASNPCGGQYNNHRSFFFKDTLQEYHAVMVQYGDSKKQIWPTEFGWGVDPAPKPGYDYEKNISNDLQAQWLVKAYQWMKAQNYVGVATLWNLDFMDMGNETGAFHVVGRPAFDALAGMPK